MKAAPITSPVLRLAAVVGVSGYLAIVGAWLLLSGQVPRPPLGRIIRALLRPPYRGDLEAIRAEEGHCFVADLPAHLLSDRESVSCLKLFENDRPLGPAHALHADIRRLGGGRFSHWGPSLYLSTPDHSDPRVNGRRYRVEEVRR